MRGLVFYKFSLFLQIEERYSLYEMLVYSSHLLSTGLGIGASLRYG